MGSKKLRTNNSVAPNWAYKRGPETSGASEASVTLTWIGAPYPEVNTIRENIISSLPTRDEIVGLMENRSIFLLRIGRGNKLYCRCVEQVKEFGDSVRLRVCLAGCSGYSFKIFFNFVNPSDSWVELPMIRKDRLNVLNPSYAGLISE